MCKTNHLNLISFIAVVVIGFNQTLYEVSEDVGQAVVYVVVRNGILRRQVIVEFSTLDNTALGEHCETTRGIL